MAGNKLIIYFFSIIAVSLILVMFQNKLNQAEVCIKEHCFSVEIAKTKISRAKGLMFRREMPESKGMLFIFKDESSRSFWMKNTFIPLDMIFLNKDKQVVSIAKNVQPCKTDECPKVAPKEKVKYVLELNANIADKINLKLGDIFSFNQDK